MIVDRSKQIKMASGSSEIFNHADSVPAVQASTRGEKSEQLAAALEEKEPSPRSVHGIRVWFRSPSSASYSRANPVFSGDWLFLPFYHRRFYLP